MENEGVLGAEPAEPQEPLEPQEVEEPAELTGEEDTTTPVELEEPEVKTVPLKALEEERRKRQEMERKIEEIKQQIQKPPQRETLEDFYEADPKGVIDYLNGEIQKLANEDPYGNAAQIEKIRDQKEELRRMGERKLGEKQSRFVQDLTRAIPGFNEKRDALTTFATSELGYTQQELATMTNPSIVGAEAAVKTVKLINRQFEAANASKTLPKKEVQQKATQVEPAGEGKPAPPPDAKIQKLYEQAKAGQVPWAEYFTAAGI